MIRTPVCDLLQIEHPIALGGMGSVYGPALTAAVSNAGGLGAMGCHYMNAEQIRTGSNRTVFCCCALRSLLAPKRHRRLKIIAVQ